MDQKLVRIAWAEFTGTFFFVFLGCGTIIAGVDLAKIGPIGVSLAFGLGATAMIAAISSISGGHINPAISVGLWASKLLPASRLPLYLLAQILGASAAALVLRVSLPSLLWKEVHLGATVLGPGISPVAGVAIEAILTFGLIVVVLGTGSGGKADATFRVGAIPVGLAITAATLMGLAFTGASMNPARSLGPALAVASLDDIWIYLVGPVLGAIAGGFFSAKVIAPHGRSDREAEDPVAEGA